MGAQSLGDNEPPPSRARMIFATIVVILTVLATWAVIEYRSQPPPPPHPPPHPAPAKP
jgi:hypothetical protein